MPKPPLSHKKNSPHKKKLSSDGAPSAETTPPICEEWKEEVELPFCPPPNACMPPPAPPPPRPIRSHLPKKLPQECSSQLALCIQRLLQAPLNGFCRIAKQQWGLPSPQQQNKLQNAHPNSQTTALIQTLLEKANPQLPKGQNIWPHIESFFEQPLHPQLKSLSNKPALLASLLLDLANPSNILPEPPSIPTMASLHQEFARDFPVEYVRAFCLLAGPTGEYTLLGGDALRLSEAAPFVYSASVSSALMEATFYGYLQRRNALDSLLQETFANNTNPAQHLSLAPWLLPPLIRQLFGIGYESETFWSPKEARCALYKLSQLPPIPPNRPVVFHLAAPTKQAVVFEAVREDTVFFRNNIGKLFSLSFKNFAAQASSFFFPV